MEASKLRHFNNFHAEDKIKQKLLKHGIKNPSPKIIHILKKKEHQKTVRKNSKIEKNGSQDEQEQEDTLFKEMKMEFKEIVNSHWEGSESKKISKFGYQEKEFSQEESNRRNLKLGLQGKEFSQEESNKRNLKLGLQGKEFSKEENILKEMKGLVGKPWEEMKKVEMREKMSECDFPGGKKDSLRELGEFIEKDMERFKWLLEDEVEVEECVEKVEWVPNKRKGGDVEAIPFLVDKMSSTELSVKDWKFSRMMKQSQLPFTEGQLLKIVGGLGDKGQWRHALSVVEWIYSSKNHRDYKSRFVYTKLLAVLGKTQRPREALRIFDLMRDDAQIYPDMAAYHSIAVTLGQAGYLKELIKIVESMGKKPSRRIKNMRYKNWDPVLQPDIVVFNAVLNACVPSRQWKGVSWVFQQLRKHSLKPNGPTYGLAMEVMLHSGKYDLVYEFFGKMKRSGEAPKALTYKVLVRAFWEEGRVDEAVEAVRDMEQRGVIGAASVYYELACCLCNKGRWKEAMMEVVRLKNLTLSKPLQVAFTGMITSSLDGGHVHDCISIFEQSKEHCTVDTGLINAMLKLYGRNDMFSKAKEIFEEVKSGSSFSPDTNTYIMMLKASASAHQWDYFEFVYREMVLSGYVIDQSKHASLLVEASRAGKCHLLQHAFDTILEAGEIPHLSFFTELICQTIINHDFQQGIRLINALAFAPSQISEKQWLDLFEKNGDRISIENLNELLEALRSSVLSMEATVSNLSRALVSYCKKVSLTASCEKFYSDENEGRDESSANSSRTYLCDHLLDGSITDVLNVSHSDRDKEVNAVALRSKPLNSNSNGKRKTKAYNTLQDLDFSDMFDETDEYSDDDYDCVNSDDESSKEDMQISVCGCTDDQLSANEILESWKRNRQKDGTIFKSRLG